MLLFIQSSWYSEPSLYHGIGCTAGTIMSPQIDKLDKLFPLITQVAYTTGVDAVPQHPRYNDGLLYMYNDWEM
jgi:hypothetical protein